VVDEHPLCPSGDSEEEKGRTGTAVHRATPIYLDNSVIRSVEWINRDSGTVKQGNMELVVLLKSNGMYNTY
jgi:hypothetical protein